MTTPNEYLSAAANRLIDFIQKDECIQEWCDGYVGASFLAHVEAANGKIKRNVLTKKFTHEFIVGLAERLAKEGLNE